MSSFSETSSRPMYLLSATAIGLLLTACGGGGGGGGTSHQVTTSAGMGGDISPSSVSVNEGTTTSFTITPDSGYVIDSASGCGGSLDGDAYTTDSITEACTVSVSFKLLTLSIANASVTEGDSGTTTLIFTVNLNGQANGNVTVDYATLGEIGWWSDNSGNGVDDDGDSETDEGNPDGVAEPYNGYYGDYTPTSGTLTISAGSTSNTISVPVLGDEWMEGDETLVVELSNISANATLGSNIATGTIKDDEPSGQLNDTGITFCGDYAYGTGSGTHSNNVDCAVAGATQTADGTETANGLDPVPAGQDALYGRDAYANDDSDGHAGFSFTKIDNAGNPLVANATSWECVLDNVTGLMWEVKTDNSGLRDKDWTYSWYNSNSGTNGGSAGTPNGGSCYDSSNCDTEKYVAQVNGNGGLCGFTDWRLPTVEQMFTIMDLSYGYPNPVVDTDWYPNTQDQSSAKWGWYWSDATDVYYSQWAWTARFGSGGVGSEGKSSGNYVRLVRGGQ